MDIGSKIEQREWEQGRFLKRSDVMQILHEEGVSESTETLTLIVASQSCDVVHHSIEDEPYVELSIAKSITSENGNFTHNKNPRKIHISVEEIIDGGLRLLAYELLACEKIRICREKLANIFPDKNISMNEAVKSIYTSWLAGRYSRLALPSSFNNLLSGNTVRKKYSKAVRKAKDLSGIYISLLPDRDLNNGESYDVNLLGTYPAGLSADKAKVNEITEIVCEIAEILKGVGMNVRNNVSSEEEISIAVIRRYKQLAFDDVSFKDGGEFPINL